MLRGLFFDQDGVILDTERDGHRVAFNRAFSESGLAVEWNVETYGELLSIGGGKERMLHFLHTKGFGVPVAKDDEAGLIAKLHKRKTELFVSMIEKGEIPLRPGILRLMQEAAVAGVVLGICTTSNRDAVEAIIRTFLADIPFSLVIAGDEVSRKKPDPEIYRAALDKSGLVAGDCLVIEDSANGVAAASGAGIAVLATVNGYTIHEDLSRARAVVDCLGEPGGQSTSVLRGPSGFAPDGFVRLGNCQSLLGDNPR